MSAPELNLHPAVQLLIREFEPRNRAAFGRGNQHGRLGSGDPDHIAAQVTTIVEVQAEAVLVPLGTPPSRSARKKMSSCLMTMARATLRGILAFLWAADTSCLDIIL